MKSAKIFLIMLAMPLLIGCAAFGILNAIVPTGGMEPTIMVDSRIVGDTRAFNDSLPERFDIVMFYGESGNLYVSRIIGLTGETLLIREWRVYVNGSDTPLRDDFTMAYESELKQHRNFPVPPSNEEEIPSFITVPEDGSTPYITIPEDSYFMLGDHRNNSVDSRSWLNPFIHSDDIAAKVIRISIPVQ